MSSRNAIRSNAAIVTRRSLEPGTYVRVVGSVQGRRNIFRQDNRSTGWRVPQAADAPKTREQEVARKLIPARSPLFAEHLLDGLLHGDTETKYNAYRTAILSGWMSKNEARALENLNPVDGFDEFLEPLNTGPVGREITAPYQ